VYEGSLRALKPLLLVYEGLSCPHTLVAVSLLGMRGHTPAAAAALPSQRTTRVLPSAGRVTTSMAP
jgi:hypothetical protein